MHQFPFVLHPIPSKEVFMKKLGIYLLAAFCMVVFRGLSLPVWADCPDKNVSCWGPPQDQVGTRVKCGEVTVGACYKFWEMVCKPCGLDDWCGNYQPQCNNQFPNCCKGDCWVYWRGWQGSSGGCWPGDWSPPY